MNIQLKLEPFHHIIIDDFYTPEEHNIVLNELNSLVLLGADSTGASVDHNTNIIRKSNKGLYLQQQANKTPGNSFILKHLVDFIRKYHTDQNILSLIKKSWFFNIKFPIVFNSLVSYYENNDYYYPHADDATITFITWVNKEPKKFSGGDLVFPYNDYKIDYKNNRSILFYSRLYHGVENVSGEGRYAISHFFMSDHNM